MASLNKYIGDLPDNTTLDGTELFELQKGASGTAGSSQKLTLTVLANKIGSLIANLFATVAQGAKADSAVQALTTVDPNLTIDSTIPTEPAISLGNQVAKYNGTGPFTKAQAVTPVVNTAVTGAITPDCSVSNTFEYTITGNTTINNPTGAQVGQFVNFLVIENGTGGFSVALGSNFVIMNGTSFTTTANTVNMLSGYVANNGKIYCSISQ